MKLVTFNNQVQLDDADTCKPDNPYIVSDGFLQQIRDHVGASIKSIEQFFDIQEKRYCGQDLTGKSILIWRTGGAGDLCFITPYLKYIKDKYKDSKIFFGCGPRFKYVVIDNPHIDKLVPMPIDYSLIHKCDYYLMFEGIIETNQRAHSVNAYDLFEEYFNFKEKIPKESKVPTVVVNKECLSKAEKLVNKNLLKDGKLLIGLGLRASHIVRCILPQQLHEIIDLIIKRGHIVGLLGSKGDAEIANLLGFNNNPQVIHFYKESDTFRDTIAQISLTSAVIGPDSGVLHLAAGLGKPLVGLFGPFLSRLRISYYPYASGFDTHIPCGPCFLHGIETCAYSDLQTKEPACMAVHNPEIVVNEILSVTSQFLKDKKIVS